MNAVSDFEKIINSPVWRRERTPTRNYLCSKSNCHSTCDVDNSIVFSLVLVPFQLLPCLTCRHAHLFHSHSHSKWVEVQEPRETVDDDMKMKWEAAKDEKEKTEVLVAESERKLGRLNHTMDEGVDELVRLAEEYAGLSLSGCFSGPLEKTIRLLEDYCEKMEKQGVSRDQLEKMRGSVEDMKKRLDILKKDKEKGIITKAAKAKEVSGAVQGQWKDS